MKTKAEEIEDFKRRYSELCQIKAFPLKFIAEITDYFVSDLKKDQECGKNKHCKSIRVIPQEIIGSYNYLLFFFFNLINSGNKNEETSRCLNLLLDMYDYLQRLAEEKEMKDFSKLVHLPESFLEHSL